MAIEIKYTYYPMEKKVVLTVEGKQITTLYNVKVKECRHIGWSHIIKTMNDCTIMYINTDDIFEIIEG